ncbi:hypothetical protein WOLCODRAFT_146708 [Wolfiporia cocos MD-104 SS10]|uniref:Ataxin-10 homolog n=1 Tax=Wolfiporia cocos (strain MD-104) TaxID=742152 RepID=A0A2H3J7D7_WOLCO|nr:hypothetical protein WOLCODRAFT_146708 [Wolfiporia cocos MD-104 SS10]
MDPLLIRLQNVTKTLDISVSQSILDVVDALNDLATQCAINQEYRHSIGQNSSLWITVRKLWTTCITVNADPEEISAAEQTSICAGLAKFTRNLVAAEAFNQEKAFENEPDIRKMIHDYTSYHAIQDNTYYPATRLLVQALSNIITANAALSQRLWKTYLTLPEEQLVLLRLLSSPDHRTTFSTFILVLNCVSNSSERTQMLVESPRGPRLCISMLDRISSLIDTENDGDGAQAFNIGYEIFSNLIVKGLAPDLYAKISVDGEVVTPAQTTLLKLLDSHLYRFSQSNAPIGLGAQTTDAIVQMLSSEFFALSTYAQGAMERSLGSQSNAPSTTTAPAPGDSSRAETSEENAPTNDDTPPQELDLLLPQVCEALVLVAQCLTTLALDTVEGSAVAHDTRGYLCAAISSAGQGFVESLIETLRLLDLFVPRITFGKVVPRPTPEVAQGQRTPAPQAQAPASAQGFAFVKRDLVRLLGIISSGNKTVQDRVRECRGIPVVMNLCVIDDQNPYLKEHAIFTLRNLLHGNPENQDVVRVIQPVGRWDENGILQAL